MARSTSCPADPLLSATASAVDDTIVPMWAMLRMSLSSDAAASLATALHLAALRVGSWAPSNHAVACAAPPHSISSSLTMRADGIATPAAALATVLARLIRARSKASGGRSRLRGPVTKAAKCSARDIGCGRNPSLFGLCPAGLDDGYPLRKVVADQLPELDGRAERNRLEIVARGRELFAECRLREDPIQRAVQFRHHGCRRARRRDEGDPASNVVAFQAGLVKRRHVGHRRRPFYLS